MSFTLQINVTVYDKFDIEYQVHATADCDGADANHACVDSDQDYNGYFDVEEITYISIEDEDLYSYKFEDLFPELQETIIEAIESEANRLFKNK